MIVAFEQLKNYAFELSNIHVLYQKPAYRVLNIKKRTSNGFLCITKGRCVYCFQGGEFTLGPGAVVYLPFSSKHKLTVTSEDIEFYRIDFTVKMQGKIVRFSEQPLKITDTVPKECMQAICTLAEDYLFENNTVAQAEYICKIFRCLQAYTVPAQMQRLEPAIRYLHEHLTEEADCRKLAALCAVSTAQFYNLFHEEYDTTPLKYRNRLLMRRAELLLQADDITVAEVAELLGFESAAYFSRFFKKHQGVSPSAYVKNLFVENM